MKLGLNSRTALITGAGRGLGRSAAGCLAREGAHVIAVSRTSADLDSLLEEMGGEARGHRALSVDLAHDEGPAHLLARLESLQLDPDIIVHNLGGNLGVTDPFCSLAQWREVMRFNL